MRGNELGEPVRLDRGAVEHGLSLLQHEGFLLAGRFDVSPHPFTSHSGLNDVRQTTRYDPQALMSSIRASIHETGHALFEQGVPKDIVGLPIGDVQLSTDQRVLAEMPFHPPPLPGD